MKNDAEATKELYDALRKFIRERYWDRKDVDKNCYSVAQCLAYLARDEISWNSGCWDTRRAVDLLGEALTIIVRLRNGDPSWAMDAESMRTKQ